MDKPRSDGKSPAYLKITRLLRASILLIAVVIGVGMLPVIILSFWVDSDSATQAEDASAPIEAIVEAVYPSRGIDLAGSLYLPAGSGRHPAVVLVHGSGRVNRHGHSAAAEYFASHGFVALSYDKRGVGSSGGEYVGVGIRNSAQVLPELAADALAGVRFLRSHDRVDPSRIGLVGFSQAGWIIPIAAAQSQDVAYTAIVSGPTVTVGEEIFYSRLSGDGRGVGSGLDEEEISKRLTSYDGPHGFDPAPFLERMQAPGLWLFGGRDRSIQVPESIAILEEITARLDKPFRYLLYPEANHGLRDSNNGQPISYLAEILDWIRERAEL